MSSDIYIWKSNDQSVVNWLKENQSLIRFTI